MLLSVKSSTEKGGSRAEGDGSIEKEEALTALGTGIRPWISRPFVSSRWLALGLWLAALLRPLSA